MIIMSSNINRPKVLERLQNLIETSHYRTKTEFCQALGVSPQVLGNVQNPRNENRDIPKSILAGLSRLGYNTQWLLYGTGGPRANYRSEQEELQNLREQVRALEKLAYLKKQESQIGIATPESSQSTHQEKEAKSL